LLYIEEAKVKNRKGLEEEEEEEEEEKDLGLLKDGLVVLFFVQRRDVFRSLGRFIVYPVQC